MAPSLPAGPDRSRHEFRLDHPSPMNTDPIRPSHRPTATPQNPVQTARHRLRSLLALWLCNAALHAQIGDKPNEVQTPPSADLNVPAAPLLSPEQGLRTLVVPPGFRVELVAAEPLVRDPVLIKFDSRGRMWTTELTAYNVEFLTLLPVYIKGQPAPEAPIGRVVMLEDTDGDGRMDKRTVYADNLKAPRAIGFWKDKVLIGDPPNLWICSDTNGDGVADEKVLLASDYATGDTAEIEGAANGLLWGRDNWLYNAAYTARFRFNGKEWAREPMPRLGQWGIAQDDFGRLYFNGSSDQLRGTLLPPHYLGKAGPNALLGDVNFRIATDQNVWPVRPTTGANRGYQKGFLREDGTLAAYTAGCGPTIYRGTNFPARYNGNAFIPEAASNLVKRSVLREVEGRVEAVNGYDQTDFLASTDEWFRPVYTANAPDGALYVVDMHRGVIEGHQFITSYLRDQILERGLNRPLWGLGRIYRVVYDGGQLATRPNFAAASPEKLVALLDDPNGWTRDEAQRQIVESDRPDDFVPRLRELLRRGSSERIRIYALWSLEGLNAFTSGDLATALADASAQVRSAGLRAGEPLFDQPGSAATLQTLAARVPGEDPMVLAQLALSLDGNRAPAATKIVNEMFVRAAEHPSLIDALLLASRHRYVEVLDFLAARARGQSIPAFGGRATLAALSSRIAIRNDDAAHAKLVAAILDESVPSWSRIALMQGILQPNVRGTRSVVRSQISAQRLAQLGTSAPDPLVRRFAAQAANSRRGDEALRARRAPVQPFTPAQQTLFTQGQATYVVCAACHQPDGLGREALAPPLKDGRWANGSNPDAAIRIALFGKQGTPGYPGAMPPLGSLSDEQLAGVLTFVRRSWGNQASAVEPADIVRVRAATSDRAGAWTDVELERLETPGR